jgi:hypothetical protein
MTTNSSLTEYDLNWQINQLRMQAAKDTPTPTTRPFLYPYKFPTKTFAGFNISPTAKHNCQAIADSLGWRWGDAGSIGALLEAIGQGLYILQPNPDLYLPHASRPSLDSILVQTKNTT